MSRKVRRADCKYCGEDFVVRHAGQFFCGRACYKLWNIGRKDVMNTPTYQGLTRYIVRLVSLDDGYVAWDTETDTRASKPSLDLVTCMERVLRLERRYGTLNRAA